MNFIRVWLSRWLQGKTTTRRRAPLWTRLHVECLEDRLTPSISLQTWSQQVFKIDDQAVASQASTVTTQATQPQNASFGSMIGLPTVFANTTYRGQGESIAVIDTGIDYMNPNLGGGFGPGYKVIAGYNFVNNTANPMDDNGHGTAVAGEIASSNATYSGVAPDVNLIALKVLDSTGSGTYGNVLNALNWVVANQAKYNIVAVNMSLGSGNYTVNPYTFLDPDLATLVQENVFIGVAAGNDYYTDSSAQGLDYPAIDPNVVSVGAVYNGTYGPITWASGAKDYVTAPDLITAFTQRSAALSILAPGALIECLYLNDTMESMAGTSMATPIITASAALLHQAMVAKGLKPTQSAILADMKATGDTDVDGSNESNNVVHTGLSFKRINLSAALAAVQPVVVAPTLAPIANQTDQPGGTLTVALKGSDASGKTISYSAVLLNAPSSLAYQLRTQLGLTFGGNYFTNTWGDKEKWLTSTNGKWYCILPTGALYLWTGSMATTLKPANLIATLSTADYADPSLLWNAQPVATPTLTVSGNVLKIQAPANASGSFQIQVTVSDGTLTASQTFTLAIQSAAATQAAILSATATPALINTSENLMRRLFFGYGQ